MSDIHSCSYYCDKPECIKAQRDELRERLTNTPDGYYCVVCGKYIEAVDGVIVHDDIPHPDMAFDDEKRPQ
jgi:hypothetical protein